MILAVDDFDIYVLLRERWPYFSLTHMMKAKLGEGRRVSDWFRTKRALEMMFAWECAYNKKFNCSEFASIMDCMVRPGSRKFNMSVKQWIERTNAIGVLAWTGMYGGTFAVRDIALEFAGWVDPFFKKRMLDALMIEDQKAQWLQNSNR